MQGEHVKKHRVSSLQYNLTSDYVKIPEQEEAQGRHPMCWEAVARPGRCSWRPSGGEEGDCVSAERPERLASGPG